MRSGTVTSLEQVEESIREAVRRPRTTPTRASRTCSSRSIAARRRASTARAAHGARRRTGLRRASARTCWPRAAARCAVEGYEIIQSAPTSYVVDEARGVRDPSGMFCQRIGVTMHAVAVKPSPLQNLKLAVERWHLTVAGVAVCALCERPCRR